MNGPISEHAAPQRWLEVRAATLRPPLSPTFDEDWLKGHKPGEWPPSKPTYVALFDVLGWKELLRRHPLSKMATMMRSLAANHEYMATQFGRNARHKTELPEKPVRVASISDSVLIYGMDDDLRTLISIVKTANAVFNMSLMAGLFLRGAVVRGDLFVSKDKQTILGAGLVDAYQIEQSQAWAGGIIDDASINADLGGREALRILAEQGEIMHYDEVPIKLKNHSKPVTISKQRRLVLAWPASWQSVPRDLIEQSARLLPNPDADSRAKLQAAQNFAIFCETNNPKFALRSELLRRITEASKPPAPP